MGDLENTVKIESITISVAPKVWLTQYRSLNPHASVTVSLDEGDAVALAIQTAIPVLRRAVQTALAQEIDLSNDFHSQLLPANCEDTEQLYKFCVKQIGEVNEHPTFKVVKEETSPVARQNTGGETQTGSGAVGGGQVARKIKKPVLIQK